MDMCMRAVRLGGLPIQCPAWQKVWLRHCLMLPFSYKYVHTGRLICYRLFIKVSFKSKFLRLCHLFAWPITDSNTLAIYLSHDQWRKGAGEDGYELGDVGVISCESIEGDNDGVILISRKSMEATFSWNLLLSHKSMEGDRYYVSQSSDKVFSDDGSWCVGDYDLVAMVWEKRIINMFKTHAVTDICG